ncbi:hypothetical protein EYZ11_013512 [Aspergillus tanneri]|uniref:Uncharacterized protein n=1 Tax=Aspergillus tanneri TaxID=1220188 RepID=A0A4S3IY02_9EURO|nr:hypothetical protein EYZ11_013512 [Aspergillus tanneri]
MRLGALSDSESDRCCIDLDHLGTTGYLVDLDV